MVTNLGVNNKQWMCKDQARPDIVNEQKAQEKVSYALFFEFWLANCSSLSVKARQVTGDF